MNNENDLSPEQDPTNRTAVGAVALAINGFRGFISRFFAAKSPLDFDLEFGSWVWPDYVLSPTATRPAPRPLVNRDCRRTVLIYNYVATPTARCNQAAQFAAAAAAFNEVVQYFNDHYRCENEDCPDKRFELVWLGMKCSVGPSDAGAVVVRFRCVPRIQA